jgi:hypothetical protein
MIAFSSFKANKDASKSLVFRSSAPCNALFSLFLEALMLLFYPELAEFSVASPDGFFSDIFDPFSFLS